MRKIALFVLCAMLMGMGVAGAKAAEPRKFTEADVVGEVFDRPVKNGEFFYHFKTASLFSRTGKTDRSEDETRQEAWHNLVLRQGADELGLTVSAEELEGEINRLVSQKGIEYGTTDYGVWVVTQMQDNVDTFERRIEDLLLINKLMKLKADADVTVTDEEMYQKFLNQYNSFESEYIFFPTVEEAQEFLKKVKKDRSLWKKTFDEKASEGQKGATWINVMSMEALIDLWKIPKDDAYRIHGMEEGDFTVAKFYYGDAVFRLLRKRDADLSKYDDKKKEYYRKSMTKARKYRISKEYFDDLYGRAKPRDYVAEDKQAKEVEEMKKKSEVEIETSKGTIKVKLFPDVAPMAVENFIGLTERGFFDGLIFHRVIKDFMIQTGDPNGTGAGGESIWGQPFMDEVSEDVKFDKPGILAMANSGANTNKSQFFITTKETPWLNKKHTIFGEVTEGMDIVKAIESVPTDSRDKPKEEIKMIKLTILGQ